MESIFQTGWGQLTPSYWAVMYCRDTTALSYFPDSAPLLINVVHVLRAAQMSEGLAGDGAAAWIDQRGSIRSRRE